MRTLNLSESSKIAGGVDNTQSSLEYKENQLYGSVIVPPSEKGQVVYVTVQVVENTPLHKLFG